MPLPSSTTVAPPAPPLPTVPTLGEHIGHYLDTITPRYRATTLETIGETMRYVIAHFGADRPIDRISPKQAEVWFRSLGTGEFSVIVAKAEGKLNECKAGGLADGTIKPHVANARHMFKSAMHLYPDHVKVNPFEPGFPSWTLANEHRWPPARILPSPPPQQRLLFIF